MGQFHLVSRRPRCRPCPRCGRLTLWGLDEGVPFRVEPLPLTINAEIKAILAGLVTYGLCAGYVTFRDDQRIRIDTKWGRPPVVATHRCERHIVASDIEPSAVVATANLLKRASLEKAANPDREEIEDEEIEPQFTILDFLNGRVIAEGPHGQIGLNLLDPPPF